MLKKKLLQKDVYNNMPVYMIFTVQSSSKIAYGSFIVIKMCMGMVHTITSGERKNGDEGRHIYDILHFRKRDQMQINQHIINLNLKGVYIFSVYLHNQSVLNSCGISYNICCTF